MGDSQQEDERLRAIVAAGMQDTLADKETYARAFGAFREYAQDAARKEAGNWVLGWVKWLVGKAILGVIVVAVLWWVGGLPAVLAWLKVKQ